MKFDVTNTRVFLRPGVTDLRISTDELLNLIKNIMGQDPLSGAVFLFVINEKIFCGQSGGIKQDSGQHRRNSKNIDGPGLKIKKL